MKMKYKLIIFDLDGTLSESKMPLDNEMAELLAKLLKTSKVAVISGGGWRQFENQFLKSLPMNMAGISNLTLLPVSGTRMYAWKGSWQKIYEEDLDLTEKERIMTALQETIKATGHKPDKTYGEIIEDRGSQITFSALGQNAPIELKSSWDAKRDKREAMVSLLKKKLPNFEIRIGGTTSIDITKRGVNKSFGIRKLQNMLNLETEDILFVGDALFVGGNDYPAKASGVDCKQVSGPKEAKELIKSWLEI